MPNKQEQLENMYILNKHELYEWSIYMWYISIDSIIFYFEHWLFEHFPIQP